MKGVDVHYADRIEDVLDVVLPSLKEKREAGNFAKAEN
jgi:hypothetical protein